MKYSNALPFLYACILIFTFNNAYSQCGTVCSVACNGQINVSLGRGCETIFTPDMGGKNVNNSNIQCFKAEVFDRHNLPIDSNRLTLKHLNQLLTYKVTETTCNNSCWGTVLVEYKLGPQVVCPEDVTIDCNALEFLEVPVPDNVCAAVTLTLTSERLENLSCDPHHQSQVTRTYTAVDDFGNRASCTHNIYLRRLPIDEIIFPTETRISCSDPFIQFDDNGFPLPYVFQSLNDTLSHYSVPFLCQQDLVTDLRCPFTGVFGTGGGLGTGSGTGSGTYAFPGADGFYGIPLFPDDGGLIIRETGDTLNPHEVIEVVDPNTSSFCGAGIIYSDTEIPRPKAPCTRKIFRNWEVVEWWCSQEVTVSSLQVIEIVDDVAPELICPAGVNVNSSVDCNAEVLLPAAQVIDLCSVDIDVSVSYDDVVYNRNGGLVQLPIGSGILTYTATDPCGNSASCEVPYTVIDKATPIAICEDEKVVSLRNGDFTRVPAHIFDNGSFDDCKIDKIEVRRVDSTCHPDANIFTEAAYFCCEDAAVSQVLLEFRVTDVSGNYGACQVNVVVQDKSIPNLACPSDVTINCDDPYDMNNLSTTFGAGTVQLGCGSNVPHEVLSDDFDQCGVGTMTRTLQALSVSGDVLATCEQYITVVNSNPLTEADIVWPSNLEIYNQCDLSGLEPDNLDAPFAFPIVSGNRCAQIGFDYEDEVFTYGSQATGDCSSIARTWTVLNWCGVTGDFETYTIPFPQLITIKNDNAPVLDAGGPLEFVTINDCDNGTVDITRTAIDDCGDRLRWYYEVRDFFTGDTLGTGTTPTIAGKFPVGDYIINWSVTDRCGNEATDKQQLKVISSKAPTAVCHNSIAVSLAGVDIDGDGIDDTDMVTLWALDFDAGSYPGCNGTLAHSLSSDLTDRNVIFDCNDLGFQTVELWVTDVVSGAQDFCVASIEIQNNGQCQGTRVAGLVGEIKTEKDLTVPGVEVALRGTNSMAMTDQDGTYAFLNMPLGGSYAVAPRLDKNYLNGVSTIDLIKIQRHILGLESFDSPYKIIASDINNSGNINGIDLVELRKLILGIYQVLPDNNSWRFVSTDYVFQDPTNPWLESWTEEYVIPTLENDMFIDFIGVKIGDTNDSVTNQPSSSSDNTNAIALEVLKETISSGSQSTIIIASEDYDKLIGLQGTLEFDYNDLEVISIKPLGLDSNGELYGNLSDQKEGWISFSFHTANGISVATDNELFELTILAKRDISANEDIFNLSSNNTVSEAYDKDLNIRQLSLGGTDNYPKLEIVSVNPNPWIHKGDIKITAPAKTDCRLEFLDVNGRSIAVKNQSLQAGVNIITITKQELQYSGLVLIRMSADGEVSEYRMIVF